MRKIFILLFLIISIKIFAFKILIPMDETQKNHLKSYGLTYWVLQNGLDAHWLLNYRGGSFLLDHRKDIVDECIIRGISYEVIADSKSNGILSMIAKPEVNMDVVKLEKAPKIAVYSPKNKLPWDDAVTLVLTYAEIPYDIIYDEAVINGDLKKYEWLHLHHEDFTGQYGKFYARYRNASWYQEDVRLQKETAKNFGFEKVSQLKLFVAKTIKRFVESGGFLFAMCAATDTYDIALASEKTDICATPFDGDPLDPQMQTKLDYSKSFAFKDFKLSTNPYEYEYSNIDVSLSRKVKEADDYFVLFDFSAKWDPIPSILTQNHTDVIKGFMGQTTAFEKKYIKSSAVIMGENKIINEVRYLHGKFGKGFWTFYGGHDPEDHKHFVGDPVTDLKLFPNSPGYRLILNNILFPAAKKKNLKT